MGPLLWQCYGKIMLPCYGAITMAMLWGHVKSSSSMREGISKGLNEAILKLFNEGIFKGSGVLDKRQKMG